MQIRTQFILSLSVFAAVLVTLTVSLAIADERMARYDARDGIALGIEQSARELSFAGNSYLLYGEPQQRERWESTFESISSQVSGLTVTEPEEQLMVDSIKANLERLRTVFTDVSGSIEEASHTPGGYFDQAFMQVSASRLEVQNQGIIFDAGRLFRMLDDKLDASRRTSVALLIVLVGVFALYLFFNYVLVYRRTLGSISRLAEATTAIGSGNLEYTIEEKTKDEIGDLSRAFNRMTAHLKETTASREELRAEVTRRVATEEELKAQTVELEEQTRELRKEIADRKKAEKALRESEERYRGLFEQMPEAAVLAEIILDGEGSPIDYRVLDCNDRWPEIMGIKHLEVKGKTRRELLPVVDPFFTQQYGKVAMTGEPVQFERFSPVIGRWLDVHVFSPRRGQFVQIVNDVTERKKAEQIKDEFIGMVSHELKTPLTVVTGALNTAMTDGISPEDARDLMQDAAWGTETMADIVDNLLELSRWQSNRLVLQPAPLDIGQTVARLVDLSSKKSTRHVIVNDVSPGLPVVRADRTRIDRILDNLIDNAIKYSPDGGEVKISAKQEGAQIVISVSDQGIGISSDDCQKLFQPFERLGASVPGSAIQGVGLGLVVCRRLTEAHGGRIWVESQPGQGSTFHFTLPVETR